MKRVIITALQSIQPYYVGVQAKSQAIVLDPFSNQSYGTINVSAGWIAGSYPELEAITGCVGANYYKCIYKERLPGWTFRARLGDLWDVQEKRVMQCAKYEGRSHLTYGGPPAAAPPGFMLQIACRDGSECLETTRSGGLTSGRVDILLKSEAECKAISFKIYQEATGHK